MKGLELYGEFTKMVSIFDAIFQTNEGRYRVTFSEPYPNIEFNKNAYIRVGGKYKGHRKFLGFITEKRYMGYKSRKKALARRVTAEAEQRQIEMTQDKCLQQSRHASRIRVKKESKNGK